MSSPDFAPPPAQASALIDGLKQGLLMGCAVLAVFLPPAGVATPVTSMASVAHGVAVQPTPSATTPAPVPQARLADFNGEAASPDAKRIAHWVVDSHDNAKMSFVIVDKKDARVFVFDRNGKLKGATPVLLGAAAGDDSVAGIGKRPIAQVRPEERTTPAGRFIAEPGRNASGEDVVWVDYDAAVSMHRVRPIDPKEHRLERLASPTSADNRISFGCINVPVAFFEGVLQPTFKATYGVVYVLPETKPLNAVFASAYDVTQKYATLRTTRPTGPG